MLTWKPSFGAAAKAIAKRPTVALMPIAGQKRLAVGLRWALAADSARRWGRWALATVKTPTVVQNRPAVDRR